MAEKRDTDTGLVKKRVVLDMSRHVKYIVKQNFRLDNCCQMAVFWAAGHKNGPVKLLTAYEISGLESGPIPNFLIAA